MHGNCDLMAGISQKDKLARETTYVTPEIRFTPEEAARNPLHVATDLCKKAAPQGELLENLKRASSIFERQRWYLFAARAARKAGDAALGELVMEGMPSVESVRQYKNALALYEKEAQTCLEYGYPKTAAMALLEKGELLGIMESPAERREDLLRALDLLVKEYWYREASEIAQELGLASDAEKYRELDLIPRLDHIKAAEAAAKASFRA
jgi:hypothetical protein